ncbi:hypothetical protein FBALC1_00867 [Flavobacteriales bacterium ALC-1]|nr:hypothetical protein FBALC1_00867 [Flavobacteriales bacterium ALC-1]
MFISCGDDKNATEVVETENENQKPNISSKAIEDFDYTDYALSPESEETLANWEKYQELAIQIGYLKKADLSFFNGDKEQLKTFIDEFKIETPKQLLTNSIISRTVILETMLLRLNENLTLENIEAKLKLQNVKEVLVAFSSLNYQINKKLESDIYNEIKPE